MSAQNTNLISFLTSQGLILEIKNESGSRNIYVSWNRWVNKDPQLLGTFSMEYSDAEIYQDANLLHNLARKAGVRLVTYWSFD
mgnify:FL=1